MPLKFSEMSEEVPTAVHSTSAESADNLLAKPRQFLEASGGDSRIGNSNKLHDFLTVVDRGKAGVCDKAWGDYLFLYSNLI